MSKFEIHNATGHLEGACFGLWDMSDSSCTKCLVSKYCEEKVKRSKPNQEESKIQEPEVALTEDDKKLPEISPLEYLFELLSGRFESITKENDKAVAHYFAKDGINVFTVIVSKLNGKLKLQSQTSNKILDTLQSIEEAEEIVKEMVG